MPPALRRRWHAFIAAPAERSPGLWHDACCAPAAVPRSKKGLDIVGKILFIEEATSADHMREQNKIPADDQRALREVILSRIERILEDTYQERLIDDSSGGIVAQLAFKSDPVLNELRLALERIDRGEYGRCIFCRESIPFAILHEMPTAHFCDRCTVILRYRTGDRQFAGNAAL